jgi:hypothetical protein
VQGSWFWSSRLRGPEKGNRPKAVLSEATSDTPNRRADSSTQTQLMHALPSRLAQGTKLVEIVGRFPPANRAGSRRAPCCSRKNAVPLSLTQKERKMLTYVLALLLLGLLGMTLLRAPSAPPPRGKGFSRPASGAPAHSAP